MKKVSLEKLFEKPLSGEWGIEDSGKGIATPVIRTANFLNSGKLNLDNIVYREIDKTKYDSKLLKFGDIIIEKSGGSPNQPVGRVVYFDIVEKEYFTNNFTSILRPKSDNNSKYVFYLMRHLYDTRKVLKFQNQTTGIINLKLSDYLKQTVVKLSSNINEQNKIVNILDKLDNKILLRQEQLKELSNVIKSRFYELFGDPTTNSKGLSIAILTELGENLDSRRVPISSADRKSGKYPYYGASGIVDYVSDYIFDDDLLLISEDGANLISRVTPIAFSSSGKVWINNHAHVVKFKNIDMQCYVEKLLNMIDISSYITGSAQPKLNQSKLNSIPIPIPEKNIIKKYSLFVAEVDKSQLAIKKSLEELETLKKSLMQAYFG